MFTPMTEDTAEIIARLLERLWEAYGGKRKFKSLPQDHPAKITTGKAFEALLSRFPLKEGTARRIVH